MQNSLKIQFKKGLNIHGTLLSVMWQPGWEGGGLKVLWGPPKGSSLVGTLSQDS